MSQWAPSGPLLALSSMPIDAQSVASVFDLGRPLSEPARAARGELGVIWRLLTETGEWAIKELLLPDDETGSDIELQLAALAAGIPLPRPILTAAGHAIASTRGAQVRVYEWVELLPDRWCPPYQAGELLAAVHGLEVPAGPAHWFYYSPLGTERWQVLLARAEVARPAVWAKRLAELVPALSRAEAQWVLGEPPGPSAVQGHMDFNPDNIRLRHDGTPVVLDWENAAATDPGAEVAMAATEFLARTVVGSGHRSGREAARAFVDGYRHAGGRFEPSGPEVFAMALACQAHLLDLFSERLGDPSCGAEDRARAAQALHEMTIAPVTADLARDLLEVWAG